jgi:UDP-N-acetylglucosamine--N-acetylmuramyl-(pentapeptide) pyrophosphoryl-undecaprenol N-acetylglucosamine transferase
MLAAKRAGARTFLHESNTIPGRANRWLARVVHGAFVGFPTAAGRLHHRNVMVTGTPVRLCFQARAAADCRAELGLDQARPVLLVMGGSQGASGINELVLRSLPLLASRAPEWQWFHLTGPGDVERVRQTYSALKLRAVVHPFFAGMEVALGAATVAVSRAGASSLAELAAMRVPAVLVPYPAATDNRSHRRRPLAGAAERHAGDVNPVVAGHGGEARGAREDTDRPGAVARATRGRADRRSHAGTRRCRGGPRLSR